MALPVRDLLAAVLGVVLGLVLVAYPNAIIRINTAGRGPHQPRGEYGSDGEFPRRYQLLVRALGIVAVAVGLFIGVRIFV